MMIVIDAGNTRIKWGVHDGLAWVEQGVLPTAEAGRLVDVSARWPRDAGIVVCNVAGEAVETAIQAALAGCHRPPRWVRSSAAACGVRNSYQQPERLGADRWAALIGARRLVSSACLVVCAGTATTVDWLDDDGTFRGGLILPGLDLMRRSLALNTAQLPFAEGVFSVEPRNTLDAIASGCLLAQCGAIERMFAGLAAKPGAICLLTGGAAERLLPSLTIPARIEANLILEGLRCFGEESKAAFSDAVPERFS